MSRRGGRAGSLTLLLGSLVVGAWLAGTAAAETSERALLGDWWLTLERGKPIFEGGVLSIQDGEGTLEARLNGGLATVQRIGPRGVRIVFGNRTSRGTVEQLSLVGELKRDTIEGAIESVDEAAGAPSGAPEQQRWRARRWRPEAKREPPRPANLSGTWYTPRGGFAPATLDYTDEARRLVAEYDYTDAPGLRCMAPGLVLLFQWPDHLIEVLPGEQRLTLLYEGQNQIRRIYLDGSKAPDDLAPSANGYSVGHWDGSTLVIETTGLKPLFTYVSGGQPLSESARVVERYAPSADGQRIDVELTLYDAAYYKRPVVWRRHWVRAAGQRVFDYECDPDSFYRQLHEEGGMNDYWRRTERRH